MYICAHALYQESSSSIEEDISIVEFTNLQSKAVISFDDGYRGIYKIKDHIVDFNNPIIIFICPSFIESHCSIWWLELSNYIFNINNNFLKFTNKERSFSYELNTLEKRRKLYFKLTNIFKKLNFKEQEQLLDLILNTKSRKDFSNQFLTWEMIKELSSRDNIIIGSHTMTHPNLINEDDKKIFNELKDSKKIIEEKLEKKCNHFAIPFGGKDSFNDEILDKIYSAGYEFIYSTFPSFYKSRSKYKLIGRQNSKLNRNNYFFLNTKYYLKSILNSVL